MLNFCVITTGVPQVHLYCAQYMCLSFTPAVPLSQTCFIKLECLMLASVREEKKRTFLKKCLHSHKTSRSIWVNTAFPLNSYKQLLPSTKSAWDGGSSASKEFLSRFLIFLFIITMKFLFPPAPGGLISTSPWFSGTVFHLQQRTHTSQELAKS